MEITDAIRDYAHSRVERALSEFPRVQSVHLILDLEKYRHKAEVVVRAAHHVKVEARGESDDMYTSIDGAIDKAEKQLRRLRDKVQNHKARNSIASIEQDLQQAREEGPEPEQ
jgi:putative sigma-54 modulation protein